VEKQNKTSSPGQVLGAMLASTDPLLVGLGWARIDQALASSKGSVTEAARQLGVSHRSLCRWRAARSDTPSAESNAGNCTSAHAAGSSDETQEGPCTGGQPG
jgi:hypothetical protein